MTTTIELEPTLAGPATGTARHWTGVDPAGRWLAEARALADTLAPLSRAHDADGTFVEEGFDELRRRGFLSMLVPVELGGGGASHAEACATIAELTRGCPSTALAFSMHSHLVAAQVWRHHHGLRAPLLARVAEERLVLISTGASDWIESNGVARPVEGGFRVSARKAPASACPAGDVLVTSIRWDDGPEGPQVVHASIPFSADGLTVQMTWDSMGMRGTGSDTVVLDDVFVPEAAVALIRPAGRWHPVWGTVVGAAMPLIMSAYVGVAERAAERVVELARPRSGRPETAPLLGAMLNRLTAARDSVRAMIDASDDLRFESSVEQAAAVFSRKTNATEACLDVMRLALEAGGGASYGRAAGIEALVRDAHGALYHPLPAAQQQRFTGRVALGLEPVGAGPD